MDRRYWERRINDGFQQIRGGGHHLKLPSEIAFSGTDAVEMVLSAAQVADANMQEDVAAFEAWALALREFGGATHVALRIDGSVSPRGHAWRLLFRAGHFARLMSSWFSVEGCPALGDESYLLNVESKTRTADELATFSLDLSEHELEVLLAHDPVVSARFVSAFGLDDLPGRQLPVGVFTGKVSRLEQHVIGPRGKSAIDLWGKRGETLCLFELKKDGNQGLGIVSELFFYAMVMRGVQSGTFAFDLTKGKAAGFRVIEKTRAVQAWLLAPGFHPMLDCPGDPLLGLLNHGFGMKQEPVTFGRCRISKEGAFERQPFAGA